MKNILRRSYWSAIFWLSMMMVLSHCNKPVIYEEPQQNPELNIPSAGEKKVLFITIEGAKGDVVQNADLPNIHALTATGVFSWSASADSFTTDKASWATLLTGVYAGKSGVSQDNYKNNNFKSFPTFLSRIKQTGGGLRRAVVNSDPVLNDSIISAQDVDRLINVDNDAIVQDSALNQLKDSALDLLFVNYKNVNESGKASSFSAASPTYIAALKQVDGYIGGLVSELKKRPSYGREQWMIVITSNHGGKEDGSYGGGSRDERNTFVIYNVQGLVNREITMPDINVPYNGDFPYFSTSSGSGADSAAYVTNPVFNFGDAQDFTVEFKIKTTGADIDNPIITNKDWTSGGNIGWNIILYHANIRVNFRGASGSRVDLNNGPVVNDNNWHHISVVFSRLGGISIYDNGSFFVEGGSLTGQGDVDTNFPLVVGSDGLLNYQTRYGGALHSYISDVRVWKKGLSADVINKWAFKASMDGHPDIGSLIGYWKANAGISPAGTILDYSTSKANLSISKALKWDTFDAILNPSSTDPYALVPNSADITSNILAWMGIRIDPQWELDSKLWIVP